MNMKLNYVTTSWLFFLLFIITFTGCKQDELTPTHTDGKFHSNLILNVKQSRERVANMEDVVNRLDILLFKDGKLEKLMRNITSFDVTTDGKYSVDVSFAEEGTRKAYVIANIDDESWLDALQEGVTSVDYLSTIETKVLENMPLSPLVMHAETADILFSEAGSATLCSLSRVIACIDVVNAAKDFTLVSARMIRSKKASMLFASATQSTAEVKSFASVIATGNNIRLYSYENDDLNLDTRTTVEITGTVNGAELTYLVNFSQAGVQIPIVRNNRYTIDLTDVQKNTLISAISVKPWIEGADLEEVYNGSKPVVAVQLDPATGVYSAADSLFSITEAGGEIIFNVKANADCDIKVSESNWLNIGGFTRVPSFIPNQFKVAVLANSTLATRSAVITIKNKLSKQETNFHINQAAPELGDRYMVLVVAGQSNAVGYDDSALDAIDLVAEPRAFQLSYRRGSGSGSIIPLTWCADDVDARKENSPNASGHKGLKGIQLPLAQELLKHIPAGYKILVIPVAYASSKFSTGVSFGTYNPQKMSPYELTAPVRWGESSAYYTTIIERTKHALSLDSRNKFLGVVWCQGENDEGNADYHYQEFTKMTSKIFTNLNAAGYGNRTSYGTIDKRSWFNYSSCSYWVDWKSAEDASAVFGGYKQWNPDNFIHVPVSTPSNPEGGPGMGKFHFGRGAFRNVIAPLVAQRMNESGVLFNNVTPKNNYFKDQTTEAQAQVQGGSINDNDVKTSLILSMPFDNSLLGIEYGSVSASINTRISSTSISLVNANGLVNIDGSSRNRRALSLAGGNIQIRNLPNSANWSISFMFKRTGNWSNAMQKLIYGTSMDSPFIGFKEFEAGNGVAGAAEFVVEPNLTTNKQLSLAGQFMAADKVRSCDEWIHYVVTYSSVSRLLSIYMNGELVKNTSITSASKTLLDNIYIGSGSTDTAKGEMMDLLIWQKELQPTTVKKVFLMGYYGYTKN